MLREMGIKHDISDASFNDTTKSEKMCQEKKITSQKTDTATKRRWSLFSKEVPRWGWVCVLGSFFIHAIIQGCFGRSSGVLQLELERKFGQSTSITASLFSMITALQMLLGPFSSSVCNMFSCRTAVVSGGIIFTIGLFISALVPSFSYLFFTYAVMGGIGGSLAYVPSSIIVGLYFKDRSSLPMGIAKSGSGCGSFVFPVLVELIFDSYGTCGAFILLSGIAFNICVCGMLLRPEKKQSVIKVERPPNKKGMKILPEKKIFNIQVLKNPLFSLFCVGMMFATANRLFHFIPSIAVSKRISTLEAASLLSIEGITETLSRVGSGILLDLKHLRRHRLLIFTILLSGNALLAFLFAYIETFSAFAVIMGCYGILSGALASQKMVVLVDIVGVENLSDGNGIMTFFKGVGVLFGPPLAGLLKDMTGEYTTIIYLCSAFSSTGTLLLTLGLCLLYRQRRVENNYEKSSKNIKNTLP